MFTRVSFRLWASLLAAWLLAGSGSLSRAAEPGAALESPIYAEAAGEFKAMKATLYQYRIEVDREAGSYRYDCVGFVSYAVRRVTPEAWASAVKATGIARGRIPSPPKYRDFFASLSTAPQPGWEAVGKAADLRAGDIVAWEHKTATSVGHAVILATRPAPIAGAAGAAGEWAAEVFDSTGSPHTDDSRPGDERAQVLAANGKRSGLGRGTMVFVSDPATGALTGLRWSRQAQIVTVPIAAGRAVK